MRLTPALDLLVAPHRFHHCLQARKGIQNGRRDTIQHTRRQPGKGRVGLRKEGREGGREGGKEGKRDK